jgi:hypothetical protein
VLVRNGSQRKSAQVALRHDDPAAWSQRRLVLPSLAAAAHKPGQASVPNGATHTPNGRTLSGRSASWVAC